MPSFVIGISEIGIGEIGAAGAPAIPSKPKIYVYSSAVNRNTVRLRVKTNVIHIKVYGEIATYFPVPLWITSAVNKRKLLQKRLKVFRVDLGAVAGLPTTKPPIRKLLVVLQAKERGLIRSRIRTKPIFVKTSKASAIVVPIKPYAIRLVPQAIQRSKLAAKIIAQVRLARAAGYITRPPPLYPTKVVSQAVERGKFRLHYRARVELRKAIKPPVVVLPSFPRSLEVVLQTTNKASLRKKYHITTELRRFYGGAAAVIPAFPQHIKVIATVRREINRSIRTVLGKPEGYITSNPPIYALRVLLQADYRKAVQLRVKTRVILKSVFGGAGIVYVDYGAPFLFTEANWTQPNPYFEVYMRAIVGTVYARVFDETTSLPVVDSEVSTVFTTFQRIRSSELILTDGHIYRLHVGKTASSSGEIVSGRLIII